MLCPYLRFDRVVADLRPQLTRFRLDARFQDLAHRIDYNGDHSLLRGFNGKAAEW